MTVKCPKKNDNINVVYIYYAKEVASMSKESFVEHVQSNATLKECIDRGINIIWRYYDLLEKDKILEEIIVTPKDVYKGMHNIKGICDCADALYLVIRDAYEKKESSNLQYEVTRISEHCDNFEGADKDYENCNPRKWKQTLDMLESLY